MSSFRLSRNKDMIKGTLLLGPRPLPLKMRSPRRAITLKWLAMLFVVSIVAALSPKGLPISKIGCGRPAVLCLMMTLGSL